MSSHFLVGWRQVGACFVLLACMAMVASSYSVVAIPLEREFRPSRMVLMLAMTVVSAASALISPWAGSLMDRKSLRWLMVTGAALLAAGYAALSFATSFLHVLIIFGLLMAPANVLLGPGIVSVLLSRWFVKRRGMALGIAIAGIGAGGFVFPPLIQALLDAFEWRQAIQLLALLLFAVTVPAALLVVSRPADRGLHSDGSEPGPHPVDPIRAVDQPHLAARTIMTNPNFWVVVLFLAVVSAAMKGMVTNLAPLAIDEGIRPDQAAWLISLFAACGFSSKLMFAVIADKLHPRTILLFMLAGVAVGLICMTQADAGYATIAVGVALMGLFGGLAVPMQGLLVPRFFQPHVIGRAIGLINMVVLCFLLVSPPLFGAVFDLTGSYTVIFIIFAVLSVLAMIVVAYLGVEPRQTAASAGQAPPEPA